MSNHTIGKKIQQLLISRGLENPVIQDKIGKWQDLEMRANLEQKLGEVLSEFGLDLSNDSIAGTPKRLVKMYCNEIFYGLDYRNFPDVLSSVNDFNYHDVIVSNNIAVKSMCEHHFVPVLGRAVVGYIPKHNLIGFSKINRVVDFFARRPQLQERLTHQILVTLQTLLETEDVGVMIKASHSCITLRGVGDVNTDNLTMAFGGEFKYHPHLRDLLKM